MYFIHGPPVFSILGKGAFGNSANSFDVDIDANGDLGADVEVVVAVDFPIFLNMGPSCSLRRARLTPNGNPWSLYRERWCRF